MSFCRLYGRNPEPSSWGLLFATLLGMDKKNSKSPPLQT